MDGGPGRDEGETQRRLREANFQGAESRNQGRSEVQPVASWYSALSFEVVRSVEITDLWKM
jgi:hypothetical protein